MKGGGTAREGEASEGAFAKPDAGCGDSGGGDEQRAEKIGEVGVVADDEEIFGFGAVVQKLLEVPQSCRGSQRGRVQDLRFVAGFGADQGGGLKAALERA